MLRAYGELEAEGLIERRLLALTGKELGEPRWMALSFAGLGGLVVTTGVALRYATFFTPGTALLDLLVVVSLSAALLAERQDSDVGGATRQGGAAGLQLQQGRDRVNAVRAEEQAETVALPPEILEQLAGLYQHNPDFYLTVIRLGSRLFIQGTNQPMHELSALSDSRFSLATVPQPGMVTFSRDETGKVVTLTVHAGRETETSKKIRSPRKPEAATEWTSGVQRMLSAGRLILGPDHPGRALLGFPQRQPKPNHNSFRVQQFGLEG